jgi:RND family efflux transporter MFP subunit
MTAAPFVTRLQSIAMASSLCLSQRIAALVPLALLGILPLGIGCNSSAPAASELPTPKVTTVAVAAQETIDSDEYQGQTEASESVEVRSRIFGYLKSIEFKDGDFVKGPVLGPNGEVQEEGQVLFTIEPDEYDAIHKQSLARIDLNQANLTLAKAKHARNATLVKSGAVTQEEFEESAAAVATAEAAITAATADANRTAVDLKYTVIRAPINGRIDRAIVSVGNLLTGGTGSGTLLTKIVNESPMYVYFDVDERSLLRYMRRRAETRQTAPGSLRELGIPIYLQLADETEFSHEGTLDFVETEVSRTTGTARIRGVFPNSDRSLASGMFVRVQIPVSETYQALLIPESALATDLSQKYVYVVGADGKAERRDVVLGTQRGDMRIITSGLKAGEHVIVKGLQRVKAGQTVEAELEPSSVPKTTVRKPVAPGPAARPEGKPEPAPGPVETSPATSTPRRTAQER